MKRIQIIGLVVVSVLLGGFGGLALRTGEQLEVHEYHHEEEQTYTCSMHPQIRQQGEGQCPICGMDLVPVGAMSSSTDIQLDQISMTAEAKALAQVQTIAVRYRSLGKTLQLAGSITVNSDQVQVVPALFAGRVESIVLSQEGDEVRAGQRIARLYAPEWIAAQQELLEAKKAQASQPQWLEAATQKLINLGVSASRVAEVLEKEKISQNWEVTVPSSGVVLGAPARIGEYLEEGQPVVTLASLDNMWVELEAFAQDLPWVRVGDTLAFSVEGAAQYQAMIHEVDPLVEGRARTATLRGTVLNPSTNLRPGMLVSARVNGTQEEEASLVIPKSAVLWTGTRSVVWLEEPFATEPTFSFREVTLGEAGEDGYVVLDGLREGERVVAQGAFAVDATAQLAGHRSMMQPDLGGTDFRYAISTSLELKFAELLESYLQYTQALVQGNSEQANAYLLSFRSGLGGEVSGLEGVAAQAWENYRQSLLSALPEEEQSLETARALLDPLSKQMYALTKSFDWSAVEVYYQYCPMALEDQGAYWLSRDKEIRNPYFGDAMLTCGEVREYIK